MTCLILSPSTSRVFELLLLLLRAYNMATVSSDYQKEEKSAYFAARYIRSDLARVSRKAHPKKNILLLKKWRIPLSEEKLI